MSMSREEAERMVDLAWDELVAEGKIKHVGDDKWTPCDPSDDGENKECE